MNRIADRFEAARKEGRSCFVAYICAGDPDFDTSVEVCRALIEGGVDVLEIGMPFSDPLADGTTNQMAAQRALESGMTQDKVFELARRVREMAPTVPIVFYTYYNLVYAQGHDRFTDRCVEVGVDGVLTLDLPPEYSEDMVAACRKRNLANIFIVAPTTPEERLPKIMATATGFIYYVSREGVTGERASLAANIGESVDRIKKHTNLPVVVGFGISNGEQVRQVAAVADGAVVGSALVNCIARNLGNPQAALAELKAKIADIVSGLR